MSYTHGLRAALLASSAIVAAHASPAWAQSTEFDLPAQPAAAGIAAFAEQADIQILVMESDTRGKRTRPVRGTMTMAAGLEELLSGTGLHIAANDGRTVTLSAQDPQGGSAAGGGAEVEALIVTAQKREEDIQDVPIAISAFTQEDLTRQQIAGGPDLITQVPNMTFTKTNFSSYSIQLRGIGTQAISATTDPAVAVAFNNTPFIRNRFFEQEFYDLQRVEVLRGPQGTLYGRNATAGVVNIISAKPKFNFEAKLSGDIGNFNSSRFEGMVNIPLVEDKVALRLAGAWTKRDGYATNELTGNPIDGRDLWSTRLSLRVSPNDRLDANLIWEHFEEDDDRLRSGKQLCKKDIVTEVLGAGTGPGGQGADVTNIPYFAVLPGTATGIMAGVQAQLSQGCERESLYGDVYQTPNGLMLPYYLPLGSIGLAVALTDPYVSEFQSPDLRLIESTIDPSYRAKADIAELQVSFDLTDTLSITSETAYGVDWVYSLQDFNRFNTSPGAWRQPEPQTGDPFDERAGVLLEGPDGGIFCDPQLGCSDRLVAVDVSTAEARQFSQELRLASNFEGDFNFSLGANYLRADSEDKYYVFINSLSMIAALGHPAFQQSTYVGGVSDNLECMDNGARPGDFSLAYPVTGCMYIDPNPIESVNDKGHNYFLSKNPYKLISYAVFGEAYYQVTDALKITAGLRWTVDKKEAPRVPTWLLVSNSVGYPVRNVIEQEWSEPTGRLAIDWKPDLPFTDETMVYGSYARGYKAGGANPPGYVRIFYALVDRDVADESASESETRPLTFDAEYVHAYELGAKNTLADGRVTLNLAAFYYDYTDYQISEIVDRSAFNRNFDAEVWGVELEADWRPLENLRLGTKIGYEETSIGDHEQAIDLMDRTAGDPNWTLVRPFPTFASSCIVPTWLLAHEGPMSGEPGAVDNLYGLGGISGGNPGACELAYVMGLDPVSGQEYIANPTFGNIQLGWWDQPYPGWDPSTAPNGGEGILKPLGGNELPNAPNLTATITADYTIPLPSDWFVNLHTDLHWQGESDWRVFQDHDYSKLDEYFTMNLAAIFTNEERGWNIMAYIKNVTDETAITGAFLNSDDTGLTTNVFLTEPRLYGLRVTKAWTGGPLLGSFGARREGPYPFTVELGGQIQRHDAPTSLLDPTWAAEFPAPLDVFDDPQNEDLDWGDGREVKLTWRPNAGTWWVAAGLRHGRANGSNAAQAEWWTEPVCAFTGSFANRCTLFADNPIFGPLTRYTQANHATAETWDHEEHHIAELVVGRALDFAGIRSKVEAGIRSAKLESLTKAGLDGVPDWVIPEGFYQPFPGINIQHTAYDIDVHADREFEGFGPTLTWEAGLPVIDSEEAGRVDLTWAVGAGVLFGNQETTISGTQGGFFVDATGFQVAFPGSVVPPVPTPLSGPGIEFRRTRDVTVPTLTGSLGFSYEIDRFKVGAGYRWERYFNAIDVGYDEHEDGDRTIDGPYFKIAVGFGG